MFVGLSGGCLFLGFAKLSYWPSYSIAGPLLVKALTRQHLGSTIFGSKHLLGDDRRHIKVALW